MPTLEEAIAQREASMTPEEREARARAVRNAEESCRKFVESFAKQRQMLVEFANSQRPLIERLSEMRPLFQQISRGLQDLVPPRAQLDGLLTGTVVKMTPEKWLQDRLSAVAIPPAVQMPVIGRVVVPVRDVDRERQIGQLVRMEKSATRDACRHRALRIRQARRVEQGGLPRDLLIAVVGAIVGAATTIGLQAAFF